MKNMLKRLKKKIEIVKGMKKTELGQSVKVAIMRNCMFLQQG